MVPYGGYGPLHRHLGGLGGVDDLDGSLRSDQPAEISDRHRPRPALLVHGHGEAGAVPLGWAHFAVEEGELDQLASRVQVAVDDSFLVGRHHEPGLRHRVREPVGPGAAGVLPAAAALHP